MCTQTHSVKTWARDERSSRDMPSILDKDPVNGSPKEKKAFERRTKHKRFNLVQELGEGTRPGVGVVFQELFQTRPDLTLCACTWVCMHGITTFPEPLKAVWSPLSNVWIDLIAWLHAAFIIDYSGMLRDPCWWHFCDTVRSLTKIVDRLFKSIENILHLLAITVHGMTLFFFFLWFLWKYHEKHTTTHWNKPLMRTKTNSSDDPWIWKYRTEVDY